MNTEQKERAIPYSAPMVRARRSGIKTNTRRAINPQPTDKPKWHAGLNSIDGRPGGIWEINGRMFGCPYGQPGDRLWTREAWKTLSFYDGTPPRDVPRDAPIWYLADGDAPEGFGRYRHGRFMMRWMSRGLDEITGVRVERLQDIGEQDAIAEGIERTGGATSCSPWKDYSKDQRFQFFSAPSSSFRSLWEAINGPGSWALNPFVWVVEFKVLK